MPPHTPIALQGDNLKERHKYLNSLVSAGFTSREPIEHFLSLPEQNTIDRLFKIDLALKHKHVDYILQNLKDDDMLYVSRALKAKWLLDELYRSIINPETLEIDVYPLMTLPAVNKMRHWIHLNLRDEERCQQFYRYYSEKNPKLALKYLLKSPVKIIVEEFPKVLNEVTPHYSKMFCERTPLAAKSLYDSIEKDRSFRSYYLSHDEEFYNHAKCVLKSDPNVFLDILEKYFNDSKFSRLSAASTKFIMTHKKDRFSNKPELYAARLMDVPELARWLSEGECEALLFTLARAKFLDDWFSYKHVEPLIKRIGKEKRAELKKQIFVRKEVGEPVKEWPYAPPAPPEADDDDDSSYWGSEQICDEINPGMYMCSAAMAIPMSEKLCADMACVSRRQTVLDRLFDEYRFKSFQNTLFEISKKILAESSSQNRMLMMLVLVSKSGGEAAHLEALFELLMRHKNEPVHVRAAVVRSLVKRASVWRVAEDSWRDLLEFSKGLALEGGISEAECNEGLHAVVIRSLLADAELSPQIQKTFFENFSPLIDYALSSDEKRRISTRLPKILLRAVDTEIDIQTAANVMESLLDTLKRFKIRAETYDGLLPAIKRISRRDSTVGKSILLRVFREKIGRKELFKENFDFIQTDDSYVNALKHDTRVLSNDKLLKTILSDKLKPDRFMRKTCIFFAEDGGLASRLLIAMKEAETHEMARPMSHIIGSDLKKYMSELDPKINAHKEIKLLSAALRANAHLAKPIFSLKDFSWKEAGVKMVANRILTCRSIDVNEYIERSLTWKKSARLAMSLSKRSDREFEAFENILRMRPTVAIKIALKHLRKHGERSDFRYWKAIKPFIGKYAAKEDINPYLLQKLEPLDKLPQSMKAEYFMEMLPLYKKQSKNEFLGHIHNLLPGIDPQLVESILNSYLGEKGEFDLDENGSSAYRNEVYTMMLGKYILLSETEEEQERRFGQFGDVFLNKLQAFWRKDPEKAGYNFLNHLKLFINSLKNESVFFSDRYVSCLPILEKTLLKLQSYPIEHFVTYHLELHLITCYYKAIRQVKASHPEVSDNKLKTEDTMKVLGEWFGRYVTEDAKMFISNNFDSIVELYSNSLSSFLVMRNYRIRPHVARAIAESCEGVEGKMAVDLFKRYCYRGEWREVKRIMAEKFDQNMMFFYHAGVTNKEFD